MTSRPLFARFSLVSLLPGVVLSALLSGCAPGQDEPGPSAGRLDPRRYVAVGDTYTAGFSDGGLRRQSQEYSFPNLLARQLPGGAEFTQPLFGEGRGTDYLELVELASTGLPVTRLVPGAGVRARIAYTNGCGRADEALLLDRSATAGAGLPQNLGVPGLLLTQIENASYGAETTASTQPAPFNPYFERMLTGVSAISYRRAVTKASANATFFTYFAGLDDYLQYVRGGGECPLLPTSSTVVNSTLTQPLNRNASNLLDTLAAGGRPGIVALLPDLNYFPVLRQGKADSLQAALRVSRNQPDLTLWIQDSRTKIARQLVPKRDFVLPGGLARLGVPENVGGVDRPYGLDALNPLRNADVLDRDEYNRLDASLDAHNIQLEAIAKRLKVPVLNVGSELFYAVDNYLAIGGVVYSPVPVRGNVFSLDGYSLTARGNGLLANAFLRALNRNYAATLPLVDVNALPAAVR